MKKAIGALLCVFLLYTHAWALDTRLLSARNRIFEEAKQLQSLLVSSQDPVAVVSLWDTCIMTATQLNAYFYMVGIFESAEPAGSSGATYLKSWLEEVRRTAQLNIRNLSASSNVTQAQTREHVDRVKAYFAELTLLLEREIANVSRIERNLLAAAGRGAAPQTAPAAEAGAQEK